MTKLHIVVAEPTIVLVIVIYRYVDVIQEHQVLAIAKVELPHVVVGIQLVVHVMVDVPVILKKDLNRRKLWRDM